MNHDEFAFFNRQLSEMLRSGIPLEGALRQLAATMRTGPLRDNIQALEADLSRGTSLAEALPRRELPEFYTRMVVVGARGHELPGLLTLLADYYQRRHLLWSRLQALLVYPALVLLAAIALSAFLVWLYRNVLSIAAAELVGESNVPAGVPFMLWLPLVWMVLLALLGIVLAAVPATRRWLGWRLPGFRESNVAGFSAAMHLLLSRGGTLAESLDALHGLEAATPAGPVVTRWREQLAAGTSPFADTAAHAGVFPRLFVWLVSQGGRDLALAFRRAADLYQDRARHKIEMMLYAALPVAVVCLGSLILLQLSASLALVVRVLNMLGSVDM